MNDDPLVLHCQGSPICDLQEDDAINAQQHGCIWCKRIVLHEDGTETVTEPTSA